MKTLSLLLLLSLCSLSLAEGADILPLKPRDGVFFTYTGYMTTVLELKKGHYRYWFESDLKLPKEPAYPLTGEYSVNGDTITLKGPGLSQPTWTFQLLDGSPTLWRPDALNGFQKLSPTSVAQIKKYGGGSILVLSDKPAEELWKHRGPPSR